MQQREEEAEILPSEEPLNISSEVPAIGEIITAIKSLKNNKAAGPDNIPAEVLKADPLYTATIFEPLIRKIWEEESCPNDWKHGHITILPKKR